VDQKTVAEWLEFLLYTKKSFGGRALKEGAGLRVNGSAEEVVRRGISNIEMN
jgi:hypothetical protein